MLSSRPGQVKEPQVIRVRATGVVVGDRRAAKSGAECYFRVHLHLQVSSSIGASCAPSPKLPRERMTRTGRPWPCTARSSGDMSLLVGMIRRGVDRAPGRQTEVALTERGVPAENFNDSLHVKVQRAAGIRGGPARLVPHPSQRISRMSRNTGSSRPSRPGSSSNAPGHLQRLRSQWGCESKSALARRTVQAPEQWRRRCPILAWQSLRPSHRPTATQACAPLSVPRNAKARPRRTSFVARKRTTTAVGTVADVVTRNDHRLLIGEGCVIAAGTTCRSFKLTRH